MDKRHAIDSVSVSGGFLSLVVDGALHKYKLRDISEQLANASMEEVGTFEISPGGYGIHWPLLDEDLSIDGLIKSAFARKPTTKTA